MFGWNAVGDPYRSTSKRYGFYFETGEKGAWLFLFWGLWRYCYVRYTGTGRFTGPEENKGVLAYFFNGPERRTKGKDFMAGFETASNKPPVRLPRYAERGCPGCDDPDC